MICGLAGARPSRFRGLAACSGLALLLGATPAVAQHAVAFRNVTVVPMDSDRLLRAHTVVVQNGRITAMGPATVIAVPAGARIIDGRGRYLVPGLADMHVHLMRDSTELLLYLANGVTTVREMAGEPVYLAWRQEIATGARLGPRLYVASPFIDAPAGRRAVAWHWGGTLAMAVTLLVPVLVAGRRVRDARRRLLGAVLGAVGVLGISHLAMQTIVPFPDALIRGGRVPRWWVTSRLEAEAAVRSAVGTYDAVKLYGALSPAQFVAAVRAARAAGIRTVGHVPDALGLASAIDAGLDELAHVYFIVRDLQLHVTAGVDTGDARHRAFLARLQDDVQAIRRASVDVTTTLAPLPELYQRFTDNAGFYALGDFRYRPPATRAFIRRQIGQGAPAALLRDLEEHVPWGAAAVRALQHAGVPLALGTDASPWDIVAGFAVHAELEQLVRAGLTPWQALRAATADANRVAGSGTWGIVGPGREADLILSDGNPLERIGVLRRPLGVMRAGWWYDRAALDSMLSEVVARRAGS